MASSSTCSTLLSLLFILPLLVSATASTHLDEVDEEFYIPHLRPRSRFLQSVVAREGARCSSNSRNTCSWVFSNDGRSFLDCCNGQCRDILGDVNNCGKCGRRCSSGKLCCSGSCTRVSNNRNHCGSCNNGCPRGIKCSFGICGYA